MNKVTVNSLLFSAAYFVFGVAFAGDIRPTSDYMIIYHEAEEFFSKQNLPVKAGIYLYQPELVANRQDLQQLVAGGLWNSPFNKDEQIIAGYAPGLLKNTRQEIWASFGNQNFLIQNQNKETQRIAKGVPRVIVPVIDGAFLGAGDNLSVAYIPNEVAKDNVARKPFSVPNMANPVRYSVTRDGENLVYLSSANELVIVNKAGNHKILAKPPVTGGAVQTSFSGDGFFLLNGDNIMSFTAISASGDVAKQEEIFEKKPEEAFMFKDNRAVLKSRKPQGGASYYFINPEGILSTVSSASTSGKVAAEEVNALMSYGEDWGRRSRLGNFDLEVTRSDYNEKIFMALRSQTKTWVNIVGAYGVGQDSLVRSFTRTMTSKRLAGSEWQDWEVFAIPFSNFLKLQAASEEAKKGKDKDKQEDPMQKVMTAITNKKIVIIMENFLDDPALGPTNANKALDLFQSLFREQIEAGTVKLITTANVDLWEKTAGGNNSVLRMGTMIPLTEPSGNELELLLSARMKKLSDNYNVAFADKVGEIIISTAKELNPLEIEPLRSFKVAESLAKAFGTFGKKPGVVPKQVTFQEAKRFLLSRVFDSGAIENIDMAAFKKFFDHEIVGQADAKNKILGEFSSLSLGVVKMDKPLATMLFVGPTGVGKTESVRVISDFLKIPVVKVDMNFFSSFDSSSSYFRQIKTMEGKPFILLMDEIDKGENAAETLNGLRGLIESGVYAAGTKNELNLRNAIIIMTGNYAQHLILNKAAIIDHEQLVRDVADYVLDTKDTPEKERIPLHFWSRVENSVVVFRALEAKDLEMISFKFIAELKKAIFDSHKIELIVSQDYVKFTVDTSAEKKMGAVPVRDRIAKTLKREVSSYISNIKQADPTRASKIKKIFATINAKGSLALIDNTDQRFPANLK